MESHSFATPVPIEDSSPPAWTVDVLRNGVDEPVGQLVVNDRNQPPRKRKGKIVWRLPETSTVTPKFGLHEQTRLWELFKQQKKHRRKKLKDGGGGSGEDQKEQLYENKPTPEVEQLTVESSHSKPTEATAIQKVETNPTALPTPEEPAPAPTVSLTDDTRPTSYDNGAAAHPPPPPGFDMAALSLERPMLPQHYFCIGDDEPPAVLATQVAARFVQLLALGQVADWLGHYTPTACSSLLMGSAQVASVSLDDKLRQWQSLASPQWECHGWTIQRTSTSGFLVVLTGRTVQKLECLAFSLTLILIRQVRHEAPPRQVSFQIDNEILGLTLLTTTPATTTTT